MNTLTDLIPAPYRKYLYGVAALAAFAYGIWEASAHNWRQFGVSLLASLVTALAHANTGNQVTPTVDPITLVSGTSVVGPVDVPPVAPAPVVAPVAQV